MTISDGLAKKGIKKNIVYGNTIWGIIYDKKPDYDIIGDFKIINDEIFLYISTGWTQADDLIDYIDIL